IGRENTMFIAFGLEGVGILLLISFAHVPVLFVVFSGLVFFAWGEIYSLFPAMSGDLFGRKFATTNYGLLYTAKGTASLLVPLGNVLQTATGSWMPIFAVAIAFDWIGAVLALLVLKPLRMRWVSDQLGADATVAAVGASSHPPCSADPSLAEDWHGDIRT